MAGRFVAMPAIDDVDFEVFFVFSQNDKELKYCRVIPSHGQYAA